MYPLQPVKSLCAAYMCYFIFYNHEHIIMYIKCLASKTVLYNF